MGIKSLSKYIKQHFPDCISIVHISDYRYKKISIDVSLYMCNFKAVYQEKWIEAFIHMLSCIRDNDVHCVFIFDTKSPVEKEKEKTKRMDTRVKLENRLFDIKNAIDEFNITGVDRDNILFEFQERRKIKPSLFSKDKLNIKAISFAVEKSTKQLFVLEPTDYELVKKLLDILKIPYYNAPMEAETICADLCFKKITEVVMSEDTDVLAYRASLLTKFDYINGTCYKIDYKKLLECMEFTDDQFLDFCIMCGTDYNKNLNLIGPAKAYNLIKKYNNIETIEKEEKLDISILNHIAIRKLFRNYDTIDINIGFCGIPNRDDIETFVVHNRLFDTKVCRKCMNYIPEYSTFGYTPDLCRKCHTNNDTFIESITPMYIDKIYNCFISNIYVEEGNKDEKEDSDVNNNNI